MSKRSVQGLLGSVLLVATSFGSTAQAEWDTRFAPFAYDTVDPSTVYLRGPIDPRSALMMSRALDAVGEPTTMVLSSPGGDVYSALLMAREIDRMGLTTVVPKGEYCFSACAYLYFAGHDRQPVGELGVHQISSQDPDLASGQVALSDIVELLDDLEVPSEVLLIMLRTDASDMHVFSSKELLDLGLVGPRGEARSAEAPASSQSPGTEDRATLAPSEPSTSDAPATPNLTSSAEPAVDPSAEAIDLVAAFNAAWSQENALALPAIRGFYAEEVEFYGTSRPIDKVMDDKVAFAVRWSDRTYDLDRSRTTATCDTPARCLVDGEVTWDAWSPDRGRHSTGRAQVLIGLEKRGSLFRIVREDGHVLERH